MTQVRENLALSLSRRQKRLHHWRESYSSLFASSSEAGAEIARKLETYGLLISKAAKTSSSDEANETEGRLSTLDRELGAIFDNFRLATSDIGTRVATETSKRE